MTKTMSDESFDALSKGISMMKSGLDLMQKVTLIPSEGVAPRNEEATAQASPAPIQTGKFKMSQGSLNKLRGVHPSLAQCAVDALAVSLTDYGVYEGLRTPERQKQLVAQGKSRTLQSKHLVGLAVDLVPWIDGRYQWEWDECAMIAFAMDQTATKMGIAHRITWGGAWDRKLSDFGGKLSDYMAEVKKYQQRTGKNFIDGPHFEILPD